MADSASKVDSVPSDDRYPEREVLPGVYLTDFRSGAGPTSSTLTSGLVALNGVDFAQEPSIGSSSSNAKEIQIAPGVYMTDFRDASATQQASRTTTFGAHVHGPDDQYDHPELADIRVQELLNAISHLERSNLELEAMKAEEPDEPLWQETIDENVGVIARKRAEISRIQADLPINMTSRP